MTQAHKTPGALVEFKPLDPSEPGAEDVFGRWMGLVLEVVEECPPGHVVVINYDTRELLGGPRPTRRKALRVSRRALSHCFPGTPTCLGQSKPFDCCKAPTLKQK